MRLRIYRKQTNVLYHRVETLQLQIVRIDPMYVDDVKDKKINSRLCFGTETEECSDFLLD